MLCGINGARFARAALHSNRDAEILQELVSLVVGRVVTRERQVMAVEWAPTAAPFFVQPDTASFWRPRRESNPRRRP